MKSLCGHSCRGFNCPLCQIGDDKQFDALSSLSSSLSSPPLARSEAMDRTLKRAASVREVNLCCDGVVNITASFIDTDCSDTFKSGPINSAGWRWRDGRWRGRSSVTAQQQMFV